MQTKQAVKSLLVVLLALVVIALAAHPDTFSFEAQAGNNIFQAYPIGTPTPTSPPLTPSPWPTASPGVTTTPIPVSPTPTPPLSDLAQQALQYVSQTYGVPIENLLVVYERERSAPLLGRAFMAYTLFDQVAHDEYHLLIDLDDGSVEDDIAAIRQAEEEARRTKYGKLHPVLYERLQTVNSDEKLPVAIWVGGQYGRTRAELHAILANRYPEVQEALARHASPFDVDDPVLAQQIRAEYERMRQADITARIQPLVAHLEGQDVAVETHSMLPSVTARLSKDAILALSERNDVQMIYLIEGEEEPALDTGVPTNRVAPVWSALGLEGVEPTIPLTVAIVENGNVDWDNSFLHHASQRLVAAAGETDHATRVGSAAASFHETYRGMAPGATILSAGTDGEMDGMHFSVNWALDNGADVVNISGVFYNDLPELEWLDRALDYTARERDATIAVAAGNFRDQYIASPGKAWNVITVGGIND